MAKMFASKLARFRFSKFNLSFDLMLFRKLLPGADWANFESSWVKICCKSNPNISWMYGLLWKIYFLSKNCRGYIWAIFYCNIWPHWPGAKNKFMDTYLSRVLPTARKSIKYLIARTIFALSELKYCLWWPISLEKNLSVEKSSDR